MPDLEAVASAIARNVRRLRTDRGYTLDELASRAKVSRGMLIQIEQDRTNPSVGTLVRVADALGVSVAALFEASDAPSVRVIPASEAVALWRGDRGSVATLLAGTEPPQAIELWEWRIEPGDSYSGEAHRPGTRELLHVLAGRLTLTVDDQTHLIGRDDTVLFCGDRKHQYANENDEQLRLVMVVAMPPATS